MNLSQTAAVTAVLLCYPAALAQTTAPTRPAPSPPSVAAQTITVSSIELSGFSVFDPAQIKQALAQRLGLKAGAQVSPQTLEAARQLLVQSYRDEGYVFTPEVKVTQTAAKGGVVVTFTVDETAPLSRVEVSGVTLVPQNRIKTAFDPLYQARRFSPDAYQFALTQLVQAYSGEGVVFSAQSVQSVLSGGVLKVKVAEPFVQSVDTHLVEARPLPALRTRAGEPLKLSAINADARALSNAAGQAVSWQAVPVSEGSGQLRVVFGYAENAPSERVKAVVVKGNTSLATADLLKVVNTRVGDIASPQLAQQDYYAIQKLYDERGFALSATDDSLDFRDGTLTFNLHEARIGAYQFVWPQGKPLIDEKVLRRTLPAVGSPFSRPRLQAALADIGHYDNFILASREARALDTQHPENLTLVLNFAPRAKGLPLSLAASYNTNDGLGGEIAYTSNNFLNTGNTFGAALNVNNNDVGQRLSGSVNYTIPWIDTNFLHLGAKPTSLTLGAWSQASGNNTLYVKGSDGLPTSEDTGRQYTTRNTGLSVALNRELSPHLSSQVGLQLSSNKTYLEPYKAGDNASGVLNTTYQNDAQAGAQLPLGSTTALTTLGLNYDTTNSGVFPTGGVRSSGTLGYGFGVQYDQKRLAWGQVEGALSAYLGFGRTLPDGSRQEVIAGRINAGTLLGTPGESNVYRVGGSMNPAYELRGQPETQAGTTYLTASTELRHNFGVKLGDVVQGLYGLAFVDTGDAWRQGSSANPLALNTSYGLGAQVNTSFVNLQVSYGRTTGGSGKFTVRFGNFW